MPYKRTPHKLAAAFWALIVVSLWNIVLTVMPSVEGRHLPVVSDFTINEIKPQNEVYSYFWGDFEKLRECEFKRLEWFLVVSDNRVALDFEFAEASKVRPEGEHGFGPWRIQATPEQLEGRVVGYAYHRCHDRLTFGFQWLWETETLFYEGK